MSPKHFVHFYTLILVTLHHLNLLVIFRCVPSWIVWVRIQVNHSEILHCDRVSRRTCGDKLLFREEKQKYVHIQKYERKQ